ncbi:NMDA receptor synaptonuclear signaling and neuronal migration factor isoform X2 [Alosa alosa]|uniref:NMDA receptor synaptonuclear signaling and neuronal migration factor isoform X2 n=1 Tax=Alosa alosa TaxID=278164 RepID=UPI0020152741|nr:NMDA receptor synaptonuclear signaling and neuronal migration factor isoform X2 [Alosa alosa]
MGTAVSKRKNLRNDAISSVAAKVRAARAFGDYLSHAHPDNCNGSDHLLSDTLIGPDTDSLDRLSLQNNNLPTYPVRGPSGAPEPSLISSPLGILQPPPPPISSSSSSSCGKAQLSLERSFSAEEDQQKCAECALQPARVYTITGESGMLGSGRGSKETLELEVLRGAREPAAPQPGGHNPRLPQTSASPSTSSSPTTQHHHRHGVSADRAHHHGNHHHGNPYASASSSAHGSGGAGSNSGGEGGGSGGSRHRHHHLAQPPLQSSVSAHNIRGWGEGKDTCGSGGGLACEVCAVGMGGMGMGGMTTGGVPSRSQGSLDLESSGREAGKQHRRLERMHSVDRVTGLDREDNNWFPKENMFSFGTATTTMQANFRKHLRMVGSRRMKAQTFAERRAKSFNRSWSDPTPVKPDTPNESKDSGELQAPCGAQDEASSDDMDWEEEREMERLACEGDDFIPPKIMLISSKVPKAEYVPNIIRRDDPSIIPILYDHEHATFDDILDEIDKRLTAYRRGSKIWQMLIFCQGGPGHLYLLKNKVATFAKVEKEEDMCLFWKRLSRFMSKLNPEPNLIHIMGCYVLGNPNGEKLFQKLKNLMRPCSVTFESPLELSSQGKEMIEKYFDFRLFRLWKTRQHSKLLEFEELM